MSEIPVTLQRIERLLNSLPDRRWEQSAIPAAAFIELLELLAGHWRTTDEPQAAAMLESLLREFRRGRAPSVLQVAPPRRRQPLRRVPGHQVRR